MEFLNENTRNCLDLDYVFSLIAPKTPYGLQMKREMKPYHADEFSMLEQEYEETSKLLALMSENQSTMISIQKKLSELKEIRQSINRAVSGSVLDEIEFFEIKSLLLVIAEITELQSTLMEVSETIQLFRLKDVEDLLDPEGVKQRTFYIYDTYSKELSNIRKQKRELQRKHDEIRKELTQKVEAIVGSKLKLSGEIIILKNDQERLKNARACTDLMEGASTMLQVTFKLKSNDAIRELLEALDCIKQKESNEEFFIKKRLSIAIADKAQLFIKLLDKLGKLDLFMARAEFSISIGGIRPVLHFHDKIIIRNGRHLKLEQVLSKKDMKFCPISFEVQRGVTVITGANMGGKTVNLKLAGMLTAMAQYGLFVPADQFEFCLFDYIYFSIGDMQSIDSGLSTFGSEISGMIEILELSHKKGLVLIDELARGTNPEEGYAISRAIVNYLKNTNSVTLFTTHFDGISSEIGVRHLMVKGLKQIDYDNIKEKMATFLSNSGELGIRAVLDSMDYSLVEVERNYSVPRDAINIARLMGLNDDILKYAEKILGERKGENNG